MSDTTGNIRSAFTATGLTDQGDIGTWLYVEIQIAQYTNAGTCRIAKMYVLKANVALRFFQQSALSRLSVNLWPRVHYPNNI